MSGYRIIFEVEDEDGDMSEEQAIEIIRNGMIEPAYIEDYG